MSMQFQAYFAEACRLIMKDRNSKLNQGTWCQRVLKSLTRQQNLIFWCAPAPCDAFKNKFKAEIKIEIKYQAFMI